MIIIFFYHKTRVRVRGGGWIAIGACEVSVLLSTTDNILSALHVSQTLDVLVPDTFAPQI
jgi:hypothetical protein